MDFFSTGATVICLRGEGGYPAIEKCCRLSSISGKLCRNYSVFLPINLCSIAVKKIKQFREIEDFLEGGKKWE